MRLLDYKFFAIWSPIGQPSKLALSHQ